MPQRVWPSAWRRSPSRAPVPAWPGRRTETEETGRECPIYGTTLCLNPPTELRTVKRSVMRESYKQYLRSDDWKRKRAMKRRGHDACAICGSMERLDVHHLLYRNLFDVVMSDLRVICRACHDTAHRLMREGMLAYRNANHHSRFALTVAAVKKARGLAGHVRYASPSRLALQRLATPAGGWTRATVTALGVSWPPSKGWLKKLAAEMESGR